MKVFNFIVIMIFTVIPFASQGGTFAIIDSGVDIEHNDLAPIIWHNPNEIPNNNRDEDRNGYQDDIYGWNFAEDNNQVIDYKYLGLLDNDIKRFFEIQAKAIAGQISEEELTWARAKLKDEEFLKRVMTYGNFMHGTHVAGITAKNITDSKLLSVKLIPTEVNLPGSKDKKENKGNLRINLVKYLLNQLSIQQAKLMKNIFVYVADHNVSVANGSFGTGYPQAQAIAKLILDGIFKREVTEAEIKEVAIFFLQSSIDANTGAVKAAPNTLFVFAAGNDGMDNDIYPASPASIDADNVISVAATFDDNGIAVFSNFGKKNVDVAAPGVNILSSVPGNEYLAVSGTSQAAPFVANIAVKIKEQNPELTPLQIKKILMRTVDKRDYLKGKTISEGIVNLKRSVEAARLSVDLSLNKAIEVSYNKVLDQKQNKSLWLGPVQSNAEFILPLQPMFIIK